MFKKRLNAMIDWSLFLDCLESVQISILFYFHHLAIEIDLNVLSIIPLFTPILFHNPWTVGWSHYF